MELIVEAYRDRTDTEGTLVSDDFSRTPYQPSVI